MTSLANHSLKEEPLEDLLLALEAREESAEVRVDTKLGPALVSVNRGRLKRAVFGSQFGPDAVKHVLSHKDGSYTISVSAPSGERIDDEESPQLGQLIREKEIKATRIGASSERPVLRIRGVFERTSVQLPSGLSPVELRALAAVDSRTSTLNIVRALGDPAAESLRAFRRLVQLGLVSETSMGSSSPTLSMGSSNPPPNDSLAEQPEEAPREKKEGFDSVVARRISLVSDEEKPADRSLDPEIEQLKRKATGRWAKSPDKRARLKSTGYSSVPPPALATDEVALPGSSRSAPHEVARVRPIPEKTTSPGSSSGQADSPGEESRSAQESSHFKESQNGQMNKPTIASRRHVLLPMRHDTPTSLSAATPKTDDMWLERTFPEQDYELRESEIPVPSGHLDRATLDQLDELDAAVRSSRRPDLSRHERRPRPSSGRHKPPSEPAPPSSLGLGLEPAELPPPGSVPHPRDLPCDDVDGTGSDLPRVGRYEVLARLKRGGMGSVYMCRLSGTAGFRRLFAMKVLHGHLAQQSQSLEAFFHEARVLGELHHPNIVGIADVGTPQEPYIVMDYVEGGSLAELFRATSSGRDPSLTVAVVLDALNGLSYAHTATDESGEPLELVHHDITPHNLLVGIDGSCRVTDFGIAQTKKEAGDTSIIQGKPAYLAPERVRQEAADHRADVFSMGVVLYYGLTGVEPFRGSTPEETTRLIVQGRVRPPSEVGFRPPPSLDWICMNALARDPNSRLPSADEMAVQLRRVAEREGLIAPTTGISAWVKASLGPTLAARRAASLRGTGNTNPPPAVAPAPQPMKDLSRAPSDAPSALETTGPLDMPSSGSFDDDTEILNSQGESRLVDGADQRRRYFAFAAIALALLSAIWAFANPESAGKLFKMQEPPEPGLQQSPEALDPSPPKAAKKSEKVADDASPPGARKIEIDKDGRVVLPPIQSQEGK